MFQQTNRRNQAITQLLFIIIVWNNRKHETTLTLYVCLSIYRGTRNEVSVSMFHRLVLSVSSNHIAKLTSTVPQMVTDRNEEDVLFVLLLLQKLSVANNQMP